MDSRLDRIVGFCRLIDREKFIRRRTYLTDGERLENDAEHAWHLAVMAMLLEEYADEKVDMLKVVGMALIHDLVEIYAGDTFAYDKEGLKTQKERETMAADRLFAALPDDLAGFDRHPAVSSPLRRQNVSRTRPASSSIAAGMRRGECCGLQWGGTNWQEQRELTNSRKNSIIFLFI